MDAELPAPAPPPVPSGRSFGRRVLRWAIGAFAAVVVLLALALGTLRVLLQQVPSYREEIRARLNGATRLEFRFRELDARWRIFGPEIYVTDAQVFVPGGGPLLAEASAASIGVDLWRVLFRAELLAGRIRLIEPEIELVRTAAGRIELAGQAVLDPGDENRFNVDDLPTGVLEISGARLTFADHQGKLRPLSLSGVDLSVRRDRDEIALEGEVELPESMGATLELLGAARGNLDEPGAIDWTLELLGRELSIAGWRDFFGEVVRLPVAGSGQLRMSAGLHGSDLVSAGLQLRLKDVSVPGARPGAASTRYPTLAGELSLLRVPGDAAAWKLEGRGMEISTAQRHWAPSGFNLVWRTAGGALPQIDAKIDHLQLENLLPLLSLAPPASWRDRVFQLAPEGQVRDLVASYSPREDDFPAFSASARVTNLGFAPLQRAPGLRGLTGRVEGSDAAGTLQVESHKLEFNLPHMFREVLSAEALGTLSWARVDKQWRIATRGLQVRNAHAAATADGQLVLPGDGGSPVLSLNTHFRDAVLVEGWRYLPVNHLKGRTLAWLDAAFLSGHAPHGEFVFQGPTRKFPFRDGSGEFRIRFPVEGLTLHYGDGWPRIEGIDADIEFRNAGLSASLRKGSANGLSLSSGSAHFEDFREAELALRASGEGNLSAALGYVQQSPVGETFGSAFQRLRGDGHSIFSLNALVPVKNFEDRKVTVDVSIAPGGRLALEGTAHVLEELKGSLRVQDRLVTSKDGLTGTYLGGPISIQLAAEQAAGQIEDIVRVRAQTPVPPLADALSAPELLKLDGMLDWRAVARIPVGSAPDQTESTPTLRIETSLKGTSVGLPAPFAKTAQESRALRVDAHWPTAAKAIVRAAYAPGVRALLQLERRAESWQFDRGVLHFGEGELRAPGSRGLELRGSLESLDLSEWLSLGSATPRSASAARDRRVSDVLRSADLSVRELELFGFRFPSVSASLLAGETAWSVSLDGPRARGTVLVPYDFAGPEPLTLNLSRLSIGEAESPDAPGSSAQTQAGTSVAAPEEEQPDPRSWPSVRASIGQFEAWGKQLGFVRAELVRLPEGLKLDSFSTRSTRFETDGSGSWTVGTAGARGALRFKLTSSDVLQTLQDLGYGASLSGRNGLLEADLTWTGAPTATLASRLSGSVRIEARDGKLLNVEPGAGRVFGLMSVAALPRRLTFDFRDFLTKGLSYDSIRGDFRLENGNAFTENLLLKGPAAEIGIVGRTGLRARDYDQTAVVTGSVGNSLPVAGALAGGPAVGAALLLFAQIFKEPLKGIARGYYRITGTWENPTVERVDASEGRDAVRSADGGNEAGG